jgi:hypothetical protein
MGLKTAGIYQIPCECAKYTLGKEAEWYFYMDKSAVVVNSIHERHKINFEYSSVLCKDSSYQDRKKPSTSD